MDAVNNKYKRVEHITSFCFDCNGIVEQEYTTWFNKQHHHCATAKCLVCGSENVYALDEFQIVLLERLIELENRMRRLSAFP